MKFIKGMDISMVKGAGSGMVPAYQVKICFAILKT